MFWDFCSRHEGAQLRLKNYQRERVREWFCQSPGYVLDFSNRTFSEFFDDHFDLNIYSDAFSSRGTSKFNRLLAFIEVSPPHLVVEVLRLLWARRNEQRDAQIERANTEVYSDAFAGSLEYLEALQNAAAEEDIPFEKLIAELAEQPNHAAGTHLQRIVSEWTLDTVEREFHRASENLNKDPEAAVTAACSMVESVCRSILVARGIPLPRTMDIKSLYKEVREPLGLSPSKDLPNSEIEADVRAILSALASAINGIGASRSHAGSAHGRERGFRRIDQRIARLAVNTASAMALFLVETWEMRFPEDRLTNTQSEDA